MNTSYNPLRLNVGFITKQSVGYSRDFPLNFSRLRISSELYLETFDGNALISRTPQGLVVQVNYAASIKAECVRCLEPFDLTMHVHFTELYAFSERSVTDSGLILSKDGHIDLNPLVREYTTIEIPINPICRPDCKGLCAICGNNLNQTECVHLDVEIDPRLEKLKTLLDNL